VNRTIEVMANRPYTIINNRKENTLVLIDVAILADRNMQMEEERIKNTRVHVEIQRLWDLKRMMILVITGATEIVAKGL
jgi:hypothetical protein